jgi:hypothetical protein
MTYLRRSSGKPEAESAENAEKNNTKFFIIDSFKFCAFCDFSVSPATAGPSA